MFGFLSKVTPHLSHIFHRMSGCDAFFVGRSHGRMWSLMAAEVAGRCHGCHEWPWAWEIRGMVWNQQLIFSGRVARRGGDVSTSSCYVDSISLQLSQNGSPFSLLVPNLWRICFVKCLILFPEPSLIAGNSQVQSCLHEDLPGLHGLLFGAAKMGMWSCQPRNNKPWFIN